METTLALRQKIYSQLDNRKVAHNLNCDSWWLLGTVGCHLCDRAEETLKLFLTVRQINYQKIDIAEFNEDLMMQFSTIIPVLLTPNKQLNFPFSVADLQNL